MNIMEVAEDCFTDSNDGLQLDEDNSQQTFDPMEDRHAGRLEDFNTNSATTAAVLDVLPDTPLAVIGGLLRLFPGQDVSLRTELVIRHLLEGNDFPAHDQSGNEDEDREVHWGEPAGHPGDYCFSGQGGGGQAVSVSAAGAHLDLRSPTPSGPGPKSCCWQEKEGQRKNPSQGNDFSEVCLKNKWAAERPGETVITNANSLKKRKKLFFRPSISLQADLENTSSESLVLSLDNSSNGDVVLLDESPGSASASSTASTDLSMAAGLDFPCGASSVISLAESGPGTSAITLAPSAGIHTFSLANKGRPRLASKTHFKTLEQAGTSKTAAASVQCPAEETATPSATVVEAENETAKVTAVASCSYAKDYPPLFEGNHPVCTDAEADENPVPRAPLASTVPLTRQRFYEEKSNIIVESVLSVLPGTCLETIQELMQAFPNGDPGACADNICRHLLENMDLRPEFLALPEVEPDDMAWPPPDEVYDLLPTPAATAMDVDAQQPLEFPRSEASAPARAAQKRKLPMEETRQEEEKPGPTFEGPRDMQNCPSGPDGLQAADSRPQEDKFECNCCYNEVYFEDLVQCAEGHLFCAQCLRRYAEESVYGQGKRTLLCMQEGCQENFPASQLMRALPETLRLRYEERIAEEVLNMANLENLIRCPFCNYQAVLDEGQHIFICPNPDCEKRSCRDCGVIWEEHEGLKCNQIEKEKDTKLRTDYEEKMASARIRSCPSCKAKFTKESGCNRITCRCGKQLCYICRQPINGYDHFCQHPLNPKEPCKVCTKCFLWTDAEYDDHLAISEIKKEATQARAAEGFEDGKEIGAPSSPEREQQKSRGPFPAGAQLHVQLHRYRLPAAAIRLPARAVLRPDARPAHPHFRQLAYQGNNHLDQVINAVALGVRAPPPDLGEDQQQAARSVAAGGGPQDKMHHLDQWQDLLRNMQQEVRLLSQLGPGAGNQQQQQTRQRLREMAQRANRLANQPHHPLPPPPNDQQLPAPYYHPAQVNFRQQIILGHPNRNITIHAGGRALPINMQQLQDERLATVARPQPPVAHALGRQPPAAHARPAVEHGQLEPRRWHPRRLNLAPPPPVPQHHLSLDQVMRKRLAAVSKVCNPEAAPAIPLDEAGEARADPRRREPGRVSATLLSRDELDFLRASPEPKQAECLKAIAAARKFARQKRRNADTASLQDLIETSAKEPSGYGALVEDWNTRHQPEFGVCRPVAGREKAAAALGAPPCAAQDAGEGVGERAWPPRPSLATPSCSGASGRDSGQDADRRRRRQEETDAADPWRPRNFQDLGRRFAADAAAAQQRAEQRRLLQREQFVQQRSPRDQEMQRQRRELQRLRQELQRQQQQEQQQQQVQRQLDLAGRQRTESDFVEAFWGPGAVGVPAFEVFNDPDRLPILARTLTRLGQTSQRRRRNREQQQPAAAAAGTRGASSPGKVPENRATQNRTEPAVQDIPQDLRGQAPRGDAQEEDGSAQFFHSDSE